MRNLGDNLFREGQDPRIYFALRIRKQAARECLELSDFEDEFLQYIERGDDDDASQMLEELHGKKFRDFDWRISGLAWRAYREDIEASPEGKKQYEKAIKALANIDESPCLGMFVNCIALGQSPDQLNKGSRFLKILALGFGFFLIVALLKHLFWHFAAYEDGVLFRRRF